MVNKNRTIRLRYEISLTLVVKLLLLLALWCICFSHPLKAHLNYQRMQAHFLAPNQTQIQQVVTRG